MYCEAAKNVHRRRSNMEGYPNSVAAVWTDETLPGQYFIHGESPEVAVRTGCRAHVPLSILKDSSMAGPERMNLLFRKEFCACARLHFF
jgi:hypothetical protein